VGSERALSVQLLPTAQPPLGAERTMLWAEVETVAATILVIFWVGSMYSISKLVGSEATEDHEQVMAAVVENTLPSAGAVIESA